ncbi:aldehyde dehydrogenase family protein [Brevibacterium casei]|uniref:Betaine-aldehyde dehydrogenase n=1 Tax=Brevibacterium casei CIP 102111 TaxID=1255625 RepID=A0A2H1J4J1_9MICO|nr:aldehyde dehydrogenase family protein [Brevibacterium casei]MCT1448659.1 aldehyde dehydrogenase family protein [Brevibacterium casei]MCT1549599.1 aldehyde dehydrogenase family protein [Brevibacterium casei]MCT1561097.1 aldehyde dehydrogenase family protein [Brevibacterium casei]MCT2183659.1 aldehyde dehydrogenase family protein [Brevibacterium casei]MCT2208872.1 aldehyde dehydrogenase family protein [Brevibacterium casei]
MSAQITKTTSFIGGRHVPSLTTYANIDPATGDHLGDVSRGGADEVDRAVKAAAKAQREWKRSSPEQRSRLLVTTAEAIRTHRDELARIESEDTGKPLTQAYADVDVCARYFEFYGHTIEAYYGTTIPLAEDMHVYTRREPYGVTGHIVAWNYPLQLIGRAAATSLATGNCAVAKPADETPRSTVRLAELLHSVGFPAGAFNVVTGLGAEAGAALAAHHGVAHLGFVGSTEVGAQIAHAAAERVVPTILELGGKSANIVFADADIDAAIPSLVRSIIQNAGQTCSAGARLIVAREVHAEVIEKLAAAMEQVTIGHGLDDPMLGPLISVGQQARVEGFLTDIGDARIVTGGSRPQGLADDLGGGAFIAPTLVDGVTPGSTIAQQEVFGPVVVAMTFADDEEAVDLANGTEYGLVSALWTRELSRAHRIAAEVEAGQVFVNTYGAGGGVELPFGGFKKSGYGREKSIEALDEYTQTKTVVIRL